MSIIDKANEYIGHPQKMDESYTDTIARNAYADGYKDAIDKACEWLKENANKYVVDVGGRYETKLIVGGKCWEDFRKAMED